MKVLIDHTLPFQLAHGGMQTQIEQSAAGLRMLGVDAEMLRWWDQTQRGDLIHFFGRPRPEYIHFARAQGMRTVFSALLGGMGARAPYLLYLQWCSIRLFERFLPSMLIGPLAWSSFRSADACIALTPWEAHLMRRMFRAPADRVHVIPNGVEEVFFEEVTTERGKWLVTTASILPVKRIVETAQAMVKAGVPWWVIGKPFSNQDPYFQEFEQICRNHPDLIRYEGHLSDRRELARAYREARGFVLLSKWESLSVSTLEAAACGCPLLLTDLPWARSVFGETASYCPKSSSVVKTSQMARAFYDKAPALPIPARPLSWREVAEKLRHVYAAVLARPSTS